MKVLIVYYSYEGHTEGVANLIADRVRADVVSLKCGNEPAKKSKFSKYLIGGYEALRGQKANLYKIDVNPKDYDIIILGTPVWAGTIPPAVREFVMMYPFDRKMVALFVTSDSGKTEGTLKKLRGFLQGNQIIAEMSIQRPDPKSRDAYHAVSKFLRTIRRSLDEAEKEAKGRIKEVADCTIKAVTVELAQEVAAIRSQSKRQQHD